MTIVAETFAEGRGCGRPDRSCAHSVMAMQERRNGPRVVRTVLAGSRDIGDLGCPPANVRACFVGANG
eukprot:6661733-Prymnesium_polylepis.1